MGPLRFLFAPELGHPVAEAVQSAALLLRRLELLRPPAAGASREAPPERKGRGPGFLRSSGLLIVLFVLAFAGLALTAMPPPESAFAQSIDRGLFAVPDRTTRDVLAFLGSLGADRPSAVA